MHDAPTARCRREPTRADGRSLSLSAGPRRGGGAERLFRQQHALLVRAIRRRLRSPTVLAGDAVGHAWLQLVRCPPRVRGRLSGWLYVVALHEGCGCRDAWSASTRDRAGSRQFGPGAALGANPRFPQHGARGQRNGVAARWPRRNPRSATRDQPSWEWVLEPRTTGLFTEAEDARLTARSRRLGRRSGRRRRYPDQCRTGSRL
jgi:hypothetical protein